MIARVVDSVVSTRKHGALQGVKLLVVEPVGQGRAAPIIAGDLLGAGVGEYVLVCQGSSAGLALDRPAPVDAMVTGILDQPPAFAHTGGEAP